MSNTFYNNATITASGNTWVGLVSSANVIIDPATDTTLSALNTKFVTTANGIKVDGSAVTQPVSIKDTAGNTLNSTAGALDVNITSGGSFATNQEHKVDDATDLYAPTTTHGVLAAARVVSSTPTLTVNEFTGLNVTLAGRLIVDGSQVTQPISAASLPLPSGASTEATLAAVKTDLDKFTFASTRLLVDGSAVTQPISAASLPLPTGAATETTLSALNTKVTTTANGIKVDGSAVTQPVSGTVTANIGTTNGLALDTTLSAMSAKLPATLGQKAMAASISVALASDQSTLPVSLTGTTAINNAQWGGTSTSLGQKVMASSVPVTLSSDQSALAVSQSGTWNLVNISGTVSLPTGASTEATLSSLNTKVTTTANGIKVDGSAVTQPVSGTVTANIGTSGSLALDATLTGGSQKTKLVDSAGTNLASISATGALKVDGSAVTQPVSGTVTANAGTGSFTVVQSTGTSLHTVVDSGTITAKLNDGSGNTIGSTAGALNVNISSGIEQHTTDSAGDLYAGGTTKGTVSLARVVSASPTLTAGQMSGHTVTTAGRLIVDGSGVTQPVSGTVTANIGTTNGLALDTTLSAMSAKLPATLGQKAMAASMSVTIASDQTAIPVTISGDTITLSENIAQWGGVNTSLGQKVMASSVPVTLSSDQSALAVSQNGTWNLNNISGTISLPTGASTEATLSALNTKVTTTANGIKVDGSAVTQPVSGTVTANAGTGSFTVAQATASNLNATVTGTVTANIGTTNGLALDATLTSGAQKTRLIDSGGVNQASVSATGAVKVDGSAVTQPVSAASLPLPTGAATSAKQPALGTAGTPSADILTVQGAASMTALIVDGSAVTQPVSGTVTANAGTGSFTVAQATASNLNATVTGTVTANAGTGSFTVVQGSGANLHTVVDSGTLTANIGTTNGLALDATVAALQIAQGSTTAGQKGDLVLGAVTTVAPSYTTAQSSPLSLTTSGALRVDGSATTQPVSIAGSITVAQATAANLNATVSQATGTNLHTVVDSGTVTANAGTGSFTVAQATAGNLNATVVGTVTANAGTGSFTVAQGTAANLNATVVQTTGTNLHTVVDSGSITVSQATASNLNATVTGTVTANAGTGSFIVAQATGTNLHTVVDSGTVTANIGTTNGLALDATLSKLNVSQSAALGSNTGPMVQGSVTTSAPSYTTGNINPLSLDTSGNLRVVRSETTGSGTLGSLNAVLSVNVGADSALVATFSGTWVGTVTVQGTVDGSIYRVIDAVNDTNATSTTVISSTFTANGTVIIPCGGYKTVQFLMSSYTSGTATVAWNHSAATSPYSGIFNEDPAILCTSAYPVDGFKATYSASAEIAAAGTATDIFTIYGSASKTIRITHLSFTATQSTSAKQTVRVVKRSATNTGGTSASATIVPHDSNNASATATVLSYTANPTALGTTVGSLSTHNVIIPDDAPSGAGGNLNEPHELFAATRPTQAIVLRGTSEGVAVNLNSAAGTGNSYFITVEWTEE